MCGYLDEIMQILIDKQVCVLDDIDFAEPDYVHVPINPYSN